jgi:hypothetical protein
MSQPAVSATACVTKRIGASFTNRTVIEKGKPVQVDSARQGDSGGGVEFPPLGAWKSCGSGLDGAMEEPTRDHGPQPLDALMERWKITNHEMVEASPEQLNHKQVQKARKGRQLTLAMKMKVARALNIAIWTRLKKEEKEVYFEYLHKHLFNYTKGYDADWVDPNEALMPE